MKTTQFNRAGVWLDSRKALIMTENSDFEQVIQINSDVDESHPKGGSGASVPYAQHDTISENKYLERRKHQFNAYYKTIVNDLNQFDEFIILGPGEAKIGLKKYIEELPEIKEKLLAVEPLDSLPDNQIKAAIRAFFHPVIEPD